jgi:hypothetical protein
LRSSFQKPYFKPSHLHFTFLWAVATCFCQH